MCMYMNMIYFINDFLANFVRYECIFLPHHHVDFQLYIYVYIYNDLHKRRGDLINCVFFIHNYFYRVFHGL